MVMPNLLLLLRAVFFLLGALPSLLAVDGWLTVMLGPDCWDYSAKELGAAKRGPAGVDAVGYRVGVDAALLGQPVVQALRYAVSGVGVHLLFIGLVLAAVALKAPRASSVHWQAPLALLALDFATYANATGLMDPRTAGHPRCLTSSTYECGAALKTFAPVVALDFLTACLALPGIYPTVIRDSRSKEL